MSPTKDDSPYPEGVTRTGRGLRGQFLWPLEFWKISFDGKRRYMMAWPIGIALITAVGLYLLPSANLAHERGLLDVSAGLLTMLIGFFVAALGVVVALPQGRLDSVIRDDANPPKLDGKALTWRQFANRMAAYLVFICLVTYLAATAALVVHPGLTWPNIPLPRTDIVIDGKTIRVLARIILGSIYAGMFSHVISVTMFSLYWVAGKVPETQNEATEEYTLPKPPADPVTEGLKVAFTLTLTMDDNA